MSAKPFQVVRDLEAELCAYTGAPFAVTVNSCTMALLLAVAWHLREGRLWTLDGRPCKVIASDTPCVVVRSELKQCIEIPKRTYISVPMSIIHAGGRPTFSDEDWRGAYQLKPLPVWDSARWFTSNLYHEITLRGGGWKAPHPMVCASFQASKTLGDSQGGAILHDDPEADAWLRRARFDGRTEGVAPKDDDFRQIGWHCYMSPDVAARLLHKLSVLPRHNAPLPNDPYPDLSLMRIFKC